MPFAILLGVKSKLCSRHWIEQSRSKGGMRSPSRVAKFRRRSRTYLASSPKALGADPPSKIARRRAIILDLRKQIFADDAAKRDV